MEARAISSSGVRGRKVARDNADAFNCFVDIFYPKIGRFRRDLLRHQRTGCEFEGLELEGGPHFEATDVKGRRRYVFLLAANWATRDVDAYLELLGIVLEKCYASESSSLWPMDLRTGREIKWKPSARIRKRCRDAARHYSRMIRTIENPESESD